MRIKKIITVCAICLIPFTSFSQSIEEDYKAIATTLNYYLDGGTNNDFNILKKAFHKSASMKFISDEGYKEVNALEFFGNAIKPGPKSNRKTSISSIDIMGTAASARLEIIYPDYIMVDYMNLLKIEGEWKIINKIFQGRSLKELFPKE